MVYHLNMLRSVGNTVGRGLGEYFRGFSGTGVSLREEFVKGWRGKSAALNELYEIWETIGSSGDSDARKEGAKLYVDLGVMAYGAGEIRFHMTELPVSFQTTIICYNQYFFVTSFFGQILFKKHLLQ